MLHRHQANLYPDPDLSLPGYSVDDMVNNLIEAGMPSVKNITWSTFLWSLRCYCNCDLAPE